MRTFFQPQQYAHAPQPHQPYQQQQQMPGGPPRGVDIYASTNSVGSDGAMSVLSNADDFSFDPSMVPQDWYQQQPQFEIIEVQRPAPQYFEMPANQQPMFRQEAYPGPYMEQQPIQYAHQPQFQPQVEYVQQPKVEYVQQPIVATIGIAIWQQGRYFVIASITPGSDAARNLKVIDHLRAK